MKTMLLGGEKSGCTFVVPDDLDFLRFPDQYLDYRHQTMPRMTRYDRRYLRTPNGVRDVFVYDGISDADSEQLFFATFYGPGY